MTKEFWKAIKTQTNLEVKLPNKIDNAGGDCYNCGKLIRSNCSNTVINSTVIRPCLLYGVRLYM